MKQLTYLFLVALFLNIALARNNGGDMNLEPSFITPQSNDFISNDYEVTKIFKRNENYYTQGLFLDNRSEFLYESGGLYGESVAVKMQYPSLKIVKKINLDMKYFAEGFARCGDNVYQLTWQEGKVLKYSYPDLKYIDSLNQPLEMAEGWGLSESGNKNELIATDGSNKIFFIDCSDGLKVTKTIYVKKGNSPINRLNALVFANNYIWSNRYFDRNIYKINPTTGEVEKSYNMSLLIDYEINKKTLSSERLNSGDVLNGIAYDKVNKRFLLTGKKWGHYYEVSFK
jgi:glutaminyl-peptide cyclotransferase